MFWFLWACQSDPSPSSQSPKTTSTVKKTTRDHTSTPKPSKPPPPQKTAQSSKAPKALKSDTSIDSSKQTLTHPPPLQPSKHQKIDVCAPYYQLLSIESSRTQTTKLQSEKERIQQLRELNQILEYHPKDMAQTLVELEKETLTGPIHLTLEQRQDYWKKIHVYIGSICRADISIYR